MSEQHGAVVMIRSKRGKLLGLGVTAVLIGGGAGWLLETSGLFATSPLGRLGAPSGLPVVAIAVAGMATVVAFFILRDSWNHTITLDRSEMRIRDNLGEYALPYSNIREVKTVPQGAVVPGPPRSGTLAPFCVRGPRNQGAHRGRHQPSLWRAFVVRG